MGHCDGAMEGIMKVTPGEIAYLEDVKRRPFYHTGKPRRAWRELDDWARSSWEHNPTPRDWDGGER